MFSFFSQGALPVIEACGGQVDLNFDIKDMVVDGTVPYEKRHRMETILTELERCNPKKAYINLGEISQFGLLGTVNFTKAIEYYSRSAELGELKAHYYLGTIYFTNELFFDVKKSLYHTEIAARAGIKEAITNLLQMQKSGYFDSAEMLKILHGFSHADDEDIAILYAQEKYRAVVAAEDDVEFLKLLNYLLSSEVEKRAADIYFMTARLYLNEKFATYDRTKGLNYLKLAAAKGHIIAPDMLIMYREDK